jgi:hypothetical protein
VCMCTTRCHGVAAPSPLRLLHARRASATATCAARRRRAAARRACVHRRSTALAEGRCPNLKPCARRRRRRGGGGRQQLWRQRRPRGQAPGGGAFIIAN